MPGTYRVKPFSRRFAWVPLIFFFALGVLVLYPGKVPGRMSMSWPFQGFMLVVCIYGMVGCVRILSERILILEDEISYSVLGMRTSIRYEDIVSICRKERSQPYIGSPYAFARVGDALGSRILISEYMESYDEIMGFLNSKVGQRELSWCPPTMFQKFERVAVGLALAFFFVGWVLM